MAPMRFPLELWDTDAERVAVLSKAIESANGPLLVVDAIGNVAWLNAAAEKLWDEPAEALVNRAIVSLLGLDASRAEADAFGSRLEKGEVWEGNVRPLTGRTSRRSATRRARVEPIEESGQRNMPRVIAAIVTLQAPSHRRKA